MYYVFFLPSKAEALVRGAVAAGPFRGKGGILRQCIHHVHLKSVSSSMFFSHVFLAKPLQLLLCHIARSICTTTCLKSFTENFFSEKLYWFTAGEPMLAFRVQVELARKGETLLFLLWASVFHPQREDNDNPTPPWQDVRWMTVSNCGATRVTDSRLVLLLKCDHPLCGCLEHDDVPILPTIVKKQPPCEEQTSICFLLLWCMPGICLEDFNALFR